MGTKWDKLFQAIMALLIALGAAFGSRVCLPDPSQPIPPSPPIVSPPSPAPPSPKLDAVNAIGRIQFGGSGCSATVVGPRREDGRWWVLTASHCISGVGQRGSMRFRDGRQVPLVVAAVDRRSDCAWCYVDGSQFDLPFTYLADRSPAPGVKVWHMGYGVHIPGNREDGTIVSGPLSNGQISMKLSVSSGDSGGGICLDESGKVVSCVCCTSRLSGPGTVYGASVESIRALLPKSEAWDEWTPISVPQIDLKVEKLILEGVQ